jgi:hypothetical protein
MRPTIATASGIEFNPFNPDPDGICLEDLALALSNKCRFTGHTKWHYSVAQHSVYALWMAQRRELSEEIQKWALLHDATEAYFPDVASPLKCKLFVHLSCEDPMCGTREVHQHSASFKEAENRLAACIMKRFGLSVVEPHEVKVIDGELYKAEYHTLMPEVEWKDTPAPSSDAPLITLWTPEMAYDSWFSCAVDLGLR